MISERDREFIRNHFAEKLTGDVTIELQTRRRTGLYVPGREECQYCPETEQLLSEVAALSEKITLTVDHEGGDPSLVPLITYKGANKGTLRFFGIPAGNEFRNLIDTIVEVGNGESGLAEGTREALGQLDQDLHIQVFVTPT